MPSSVIFLLIAILIVGALVFVAITINQKKGHSFDVEEYQTNFLKIENSLNKEQNTSFTACIVEADKLLDKALMEMGIPGKTMGDRLKRSGERFTQLNAVWHAHKLRNQIAHEAGFEITYTQSRHALTVYRQALKDLGAI